MLSFGDTATCSATSQNEKILSFLSIRTTVALFIRIGKVAEDGNRLKSAARNGPSSREHSLSNHVGNGSGSECLHGAEPISLMAYCEDTIAN